jgi:hypothetical protein
MLVSLWVLIMLTFKFLQWNSGLGCSLCLCVTWVDQFWCSRKAEHSWERSTEGQVWKARVTGIKRIRISSSERLALVCQNMGVGVRWTKTCLPTPRTIAGILETWKRTTGEEEKYFFSIPPTQGHPELTELEIPVGGEETRFTSRSWGHQITI